MDLTPYRYSDQALRYLRDASPEERATARETIDRINRHDPTLLSSDAVLTPGVRVTLMPNGHVVLWRVHPEFPMLYEILALRSLDA